MENGYIADVVPGYGLDTGMMHGVAVLLPIFMILGMIMLCAVFVCIVMFVIGLVAGKTMFSVITSKERTVEEPQYDMV